MTTADEFLKTVIEKIDALKQRDATLYDTLESTYRLTDRPNVTHVDAAEPWLWHNKWGGTIVDDDGENFVIAFGDGSQAEWDNWDRSWKEWVESC